MPVIFGTVYDDAGRPKPSVNVKVERVLVDGSTALTTTVVSDNQGGYQATVSAQDAACLSVRVTLTSETPEVVQTVVSPSDPQRVDFWLGGARRAVYSERYDRLQRVLDCDLKTYRDLDSRGLAQLAITAGIEPAVASAFRDADASAALTSLPQPLFYAMAHSGLSAHVSELVKLPGAQRVAALDAAVADGALSASDADAARAALGALDERAITSALAVGTTVATHGFTMALSGVTTDMPALLRAWRDHTGSNESFWNSVQLPAADVEKLQLAFQLQSLTRAHAPLMTALAGQHTSLVSMVSLDRAGWESAVATSGVPQALTDAGVATATYAGAMFEAIEDTFPTEMLSARSAMFSSGQALQNFLAGTPSYRLHGTPLREFLRQNPGALSAAGTQAQQDAVAAELPVLERLFRISPRGARFETMQHLSGAGFASATQIRRMGERRFVASMSSTLGPAIATQVFRKARALSDTALTVRMRHGATGPAPGFASLPLVSAGQPTGSSDGVGWDLLFGGRTFCACDVCQSSAGPAAHLADQLFWLDSRGDAPTFLEVLVSRRPDVEALELSCKNANTVLPAIDLIIEQLEFEVEPMGALASRQTTGDEAELAARPEHMHQRAYDRLAGKDSPPIFYPFEQPYISGLDRTRTFLRALGTGRSVLQWILIEGGPTAGVKVPEVAAELLEVNRTSWSILAGDLSAPSNERWGVADVAELTQAPALLRQAADRAAEQPLTYRELEELLRTRYVQDAGALAVWFSNRVCDVSGAQLVPASAALLGPQLDRLSKLIRLTRELGWSVRDVDRAIEIFRESAPGPLADGDISEGLLCSLAAVRWLSRALGREGPELLSWWGDLDTRRWAERLTSGTPAGLPAGTDLAEGSGRVPRLASANAGGAEAEPSPFQRMVGDIPNAQAFEVVDDGSAIVDEMIRTGAPTIEARLDAVASVVGVHTDDLSAGVEALGTQTYWRGTTDGTMEGSERMTRVVMFRIDKPLVDEQDWLFTNTSGWMLLASSGSVFFWMNNVSAVKQELSGLVVGETYVLVATYDGATKELRVNDLVAAPKAYTGAVGTSAHGVTIGAENLGGDRRSNSITILGCAASDTAVLSETNEYVHACLAHGRVLPFEGVEHLYLLSEGLHRDQVGGYDLTPHSGLTLRNLSQLRRREDASRAFGLSAERLSRWAAWTGIDPFSSPQDAVAFVSELQRQASVGISEGVFEELLAEPGARALSELGAPAAGEALLALSDELRANAGVEGEPPNAAERERAVSRRVAALLSVDAAVVDALLDGMFHQATPLRAALLEAAGAVATARAADPVGEADPDTLTTHFDPAIWETVAIAGWLSRVFAMRAEDMPWAVGETARRRLEQLPASPAWTPSAGASVTSGQADPASGTAAVELTDTSNSADGAAAVSSTAYAGGPVLASVWIKKDSAASHFAEVRVKYDTWSSALRLNLDTGAVDVSRYGFSDARVESRQGWWFVTAAHPGDLRSGAVSLEVSPARGLLSAFPAADVSSTGAVTVFAPSIRGLLEWEGIAFGHSAPARYSAWSKSRETARVQTLFSEDDRLYDLLTSIEDGSLTSASDLRARLASGTGWKESDLAEVIDDAFAGPLGGAAVGDWANPERLSRLAALMAQASQLRVPPSKLARWGALVWADDGQFDDPIDEYRAHANELEQTLRASWGDKRWFSDMHAVQDELRERRRDALLSRAVGARFTVATHGFSSANYLWQHHGQMEGSTSMTRVVVFRLDAPPAADSFLFGKNPDATSGWGLFVNASSELVWQVHGTANAVTSPPLGLNATYAAVATYDGASLALTVNQETVAPKAFTEAVGVGPLTVAVGARDHSGALPAAGVSIFGCAASDLVAMPSPADYIAACLAGSRVQPFDGVEHLYSAHLGLETDQVKTLSLWVRGTPTTSIVESSSYTADALAQDLLIDLQMGACAKTSRLVDATRTVQLFVQRALLGQEGGLALSEDEAREWLWRKNYRLWEANRKVFLYPESWLQPELRRDKTPFFEQLESELAQGELSEDNVEAAYRTYLRSLSSVSKLEVITLLRQPHPSRAYGAGAGDTAGGGLTAADASRPETIHVFARTRGVPHSYYHREWRDGRKWTPWRLITRAKINGEHLFPIVYQRRLMLFWLTISETSEQGDATHAAATGDLVAAPNRYFHIRLSWSELRDGVWAPATLAEPTIGIDERGQVSPADLSPSVLNARIDTGWVRRTVPTSVIHGKVEEAANGRDLLIQLFRDGPEAGAVTILPRFRVSGVDGSVTAERGQPFGVHAAPPQELGVPYRGIAQRFVGGHDLSLPFRHPQAGRVIQQVLTAGASTESTALRITPLSRVSFDSRDPFVFEDDAGSYWVTFASVPTYLLPLRTGLDPDILFRGDLRLPPAVRRQLRAGAALRGSGGGSLVGSGVGSLIGAGAVREVESAGRSVVSLAGAALSKAAPRTEIRSNIVVQDTTQAIVYQAISGSDSDVDETLYADLAFAIPSLNLSGESTEGVHLFRPNSAVFRFQSFFHPHVPAMREALNRGGVFGLLRPGAADPLAGQDPAPPTTLAARYTLHAVATPRPADDLDFEPDGAYAQYNWELFFHAPFLIAARLHDAGRFQDALEWLHVIFDPTGASPEGASDAEVAQSHWRFRRFREEFAVGGATPRNILELLALLTADASDRDALTSARRLLQQISEWRQHPFDPHAIARVRTQTYMAAVVMRYLDILLDWGDRLFSQGTRESVAEAAELYLLVARILGPRPEGVDVADPPTRTFAQLLEDFRSGVGPVERLEEAVSDVFEVIEDDISGEADSLPALMYFCTPPNPELATRYWDRAADRLFKVRNCLDIEGKRVDLALFSPPIDPALLVRAAAAGVDLQTLLADVTLGAPPHRRYLALADLAGGLAASAQALGQAMVAAIEKRDADQLAMLRSTHSRALQQQTIELRRQQVTETEHELGALRQARESTRRRVAFYTDRPRTNEAEDAHGRMARDAKNSHLNANTMATGAAFTNAIPSFSVGFSGGPHSTVSVGGANLAALMFSGPAQIVRGEAAALDAAARRLLTQSGYDRRKENWDLQAELAATELLAVERRIAAAEIRAALARRSLEIAEQRLGQIEEIQTFMELRFGREDLYDWLAGQLAGLHYQSYQLAYEFAKKAERAWQYELGRSDGFIQFGYFDSRRRGLLAGERLSHDLRRMQVAYVDVAKRRLEVEQTFSLREINPLQLLKLQETGDAAFDIPEAFFDLYYPGQFRRRIRAVRLTVPAVVPPNTNLPVQLSLSAHRIRKAAGTELESGGYGAPPVSAIATSTGQRDAGVFELNFSAARLLPFEGAGAVSTWDITLPGALRTFDYRQIEDVLLHVAYDADYDGVHRESLEAEASGAPRVLRDLLPAGPTPYRLMISLRHEHGGAFRRLMHSPVDTGVAFEITLESVPAYLRDAWVKTGAGRVSIANPVFGIRGSASPALTFNGQPIAAAAWSDWAAVAPSLRSAEIPGAALSTLVGIHTLVISDFGGIDPADDDSDIFLVVDLGVS